MTDNDRIPQVLVVDDEPNIRELVQVALKFHGCAVAVSASGKDALHQVGAYDPDLMILDVMLPDMDGFEVCRTLRSEGNDVPVIFLTARDTTSDTIRGLTLGGDDYVTKPFSVEALVARVRAVLRRTTRAPGGDGVVDDGALLTGGRPGTGRGALGGAPRRDPGGAVADRVPAARVPDAQPGTDADQAAAAGERVGLGVRRPVPGGGDVCQLPAA
jgi:Response regulators consisting of a CheY-like receiver domain and a winged-helix DNA-binding domain